MEYQIGFSLESAQLLATQSPWLSLATLLLVCAWLYQSASMIVKYTDLILNREKLSKNYLAQLPRELCFVLFTACSVALLATSALWTTRQTLPHLPSLIASGTAFIWFLLYLSVFQRAARQHCNAFITVATLWAISGWIQASYPAFATLCLAIQSLMLMGATLVTWTNTQSVRRHILNGNLVVCMGLIFMAVALMLPSNNINTYLATDLHLASACFVLATVMHIVYQCATGKNLTMGLTASHQVIQRMMLDLQHLADQNAEKVETAQKQKNNLVKKISDELKTPLNAILGSLNLVRDSKSQQQENTYLDRAESSANHLLTLVNDIVDLNQLNTDQLQLNPEPIVLKRLLEQAFEALKTQAIDKGLEFKLSISDNQHPEVLGDSNRIKYILQELISNAIKFTPQGSINIDLSFKLLKSGHALFKFCVQDTGAGVTPEDQKKIFKAFEKSADFFERQSGSPGIGLSICSQLVKLMGGSLRFTSIPEAGTKVTVQFKLPIASTYSEDIQSSAVNAQIIETASISQPHDALKPRFEGIHALIVENNPINQMVLDGLLKKMGAQTHLVNDGQQAVDFVSSAQSDNLNIILMDCQMPMMNGYDATRAIRKLANGNIPIIAVTTNTNAEDIAACKASGMDDHLAKPVTPHTLGPMLEQWLQAYEQLSSSSHT